jgi:hypothetical protein
VVSGRLESRTIGFHVVIWWKMRTVSPRIHCELVSTGTEMVALDVIKIEYERVVRRVRLC